MDESATAVAEEIHAPVGIDAPEAVAVLGHV
jgi:hypothetical protein